MHNSSSVVILILLIILPIVAVAAGWPLWLTMLAVIAVLLGWQAANLAQLVRQHRGDELELETTGVSHFVEKVRWCMDRLGLEYVEKPRVGTLGALYKGRSVPTLHVYGRGFGRWSIGNSSDILRYLWGRYGEDNPQAKFLRPTRPRLALEASLDAYGRDLQRWIYYHILPHRKLTLRAWGAEDPAVPLWQRLLIKVLFAPHTLIVGRSFRVSRRGYKRSCERIEALLGEMENILADAGSITGESEPNYCDLTLAALSGLWLQPPEFGGGRAANVLTPLDQLPAGLRMDRDRWMGRFPLLTAQIVALYTTRTSAVGS